ncbi:MAG: beta-galactosidase, partial [Clostridia bacterium]|nr:beta-galactosidase [Clostridia bacterium]
MHVFIDLKGVINMNIPRPEYPRPRLVRDQWMNLNGPWKFEFDFGDSGKVKELWKEGNGTFDKEIIVPFVPESKLSGIEYTDFFTTCWYKRTITLPENWAKEQGHILLHIGAADFYTECWVNEVRVGDHRGGYTPFCFDVTQAVKAGENTI